MEEIKLTKDQLAVMLLEMYKTGFTTAITSIKEFEPIVFPIAEKQIKNTLMDSLLNKLNIKIGD